MIGQEAVEGWRQANAEREKAHSWAKQLQVCGML
jgi:hypothetical protein